MGTTVCVDIIPRWAPQRRLPMAKSPKVVKPAAKQPKSEPSPSKSDKGSAGYAYPGVHQQTHVK